MHSSIELMVRKSSTVILSLRGSGSWKGCLSGKKEVTLASTPESICLSIAMPIKMLVTVFVAERVFCSAEASDPLK